MTDAVSSRPAFVQDLLAAEERAVPLPLRSDPRRELGLDDVPRDHYVSREYADLEAERLWPRVWQMACREEQIPNVGDHVVYEVADLSYVVIRTADGVRAFVNSCLHRGTTLAEAPGCSAVLRCPFHGFTWNLDGELTHVPTPWDFPHVEPESYRLPEAQVDTWGGFVFINPDRSAGPLTDYLGGFVEQFAPWPLEDRYITADVARIVPCNWKVALEAFIEAFHTWTVHPQLRKTSGDTQTQYDVFEGEPHWNRMVNPIGIASENFGSALSEQEIADALILDSGTELASGQTARGMLADRIRGSLARRTGRDWSEISDSEAVDGIEYFVFPNFVPWAGYQTPLVYRFRPHGDDPGESLLEVMLLDPLPDSDERPDPATRRVLEPDQSFADAPELGFLGPVLDQDAARFGRIQRGLRASAREGVMLSSYQEVRIRHFHQVLTDYLGR